MNYFCCDERRRNAVAAHAALNGTEFLEVSDDPADPVELRQRTLYVHFLKPVPAGTLTAASFRVEGGERVRNIEVKNIIEAPGGDAHVIAVEVDRAGDFSVYTLRLLDDSDPPVFDPVLSAVDFSFKVACPTDFDCEEQRPCADEPGRTPELNYLAKDYASFRQLMLDRMSALMPGWQERHAADVGVALVEVLSYVGDYLSYQQDAVATEAYLGTARRRVSVRRHARLVDYHLRDGSNARAWVQIRVASDGVQLDAGTQIFTRLRELPERIEHGSENYEKALNGGPIIFQTAHEATLFASHNDIRFHTWGEERCCLPEGATRATLRNDAERLQHLQVGDVLIFKEARNPQNGIADEADPARRHAVRIKELKNGIDPLVTEDEGGLQPLRVLEIRWDGADALPFPLCLWEVAVAGDESDRQPASVALGNIVLADHGLTIRDEPLGQVPSSSPELDKIRPHPSDFCREPRTHVTPPRFRPRLSRTDLTHAPAHDPTRPAAEALRASPALPQVSLTGTLLGQVSTWTARRDLLNSDAGKPEFVVETESDGAAIIRFGDDRFGSRPASGTTFTATYRAGNGTRGNVGAETLAHIVTSQQAVLEVSNPLAAGGGTEAESLERARQDAPVAFRRQERAVTPQDYAEVAERHEGVQRAAATIRWTGSWRTVFLTIDRRGGLDVNDEFEREMRRHLERFRMAGHDLEIDGPRYVPLEIEMVVCVKPNFFRGHVRAALLEVFSGRTRRGGHRGLFHPDNYTFGQTVFLSPLVAAAQAIEGVDSVTVTRFARQGAAGAGGIAAGKLELGRLEIARLDNDPNFPDRGVFRPVLKGGR